MARPCGGGRCRGLRRRRRRPGGLAAAGAAALVLVLHALPARRWRRGARRPRAARHALVTARSLARLGRWRARWLAAAGLLLSFNMRSCAERRLATGPWRRTLFFLQHALLGRTAAAARTAGTGRRCPCRSPSACAPGAAAADVAPGGGPLAAAPGRVGRGVTARMTFAGTRLADRLRRGRRCDNLDRPRLNRSRRLDRT